MRSERKREVNNDALGKLKRQKKKIIIPSTAIVKAPEMNF
jgi:hypothetical protein